MARDREIPCQFYLAEGNCKLGHKGTFKKACQKCHFYKAEIGREPRRVDKRKTLLKRAAAHDSLDY